MPSQPQALGAVKTLSRLVNSMYESMQRKMPTVAIGGIDLSNAQAVLNQGVTSLAVVQALTQSDMPQQVIQRFNLIFDDTKPEHYCKEEVRHV
ncbi:thiamine phosphate synthase [Vibrio sp. PP-XX7]